MDMSDIQSFGGSADLRGEMRLSQSMKKYTSWHVGGEADRLYLPADLPDLARFFRHLGQDEPLHVIGLGSNLLVRDGGIRGTVVVLHARLSELFLEQQDESGALVYAGAGVACAKVARFAALHDLAGAEFLAGIPGTVGGALAMNAGCYGGETWDVVKQVHTLNRRGESLQRSRDDYEIGYRQVALKPGTESDGRSGRPVSNIHDEWFAGAWLSLPRGNMALSRQRIKALLSRRINSQPLGQPNAGSVFRNPPGDWAARLIESCGLKGLCIGGALISSKHANFIVNLGTATAADIESLILTVRKVVKEKTGIDLQHEVKIIGDRYMPHQDQQELTESKWR